MSIVPLKEGKDFKCKLQKDSVIITDDMITDTVYLECAICRLGINKLGIIVCQDTKQHYQKGKMIGDNNKCIQRTNSCSKFTFHSLIPPNYGLYA